GGAEGSKPSAEGQDKSPGSQRAAPPPPPPPPPPPLPPPPGLGKQGPKKKGSGDDKGPGSLWEWANAPEQRPFVRLGLAVVGALLVLSFMDQKPPELTIQELKNRYL